MAARTGDFKVELDVRIAGPELPYSKLGKRHGLHAHGQINLPFAPFPGLLLTLTRSRRNRPWAAVYLRVRCVEWRVPERRFSCTADETLMSKQLDLDMEVRGLAWKAKPLADLGESFRSLGFEVSSCVFEDRLALEKEPDGSLRDPPKPPHEVQVPARRRGAFG